MITANRSASRPCGFPMVLPSYSCTPHTSVWGPAYRCSGQEMAQKRYLFCTVSIGADDEQSTEFRSGPGVRPPGGWLTFRPPRRRHGADGPGCRQRTPTSLGRCDRQIRRASDAAQRDGTNSQSAKTGSRHPDHQRFARAPRHRRHAVQGVGRKRDQGAAFARCGDQGTVVNLQLAAFVILRLG